MKKIILSLAVLLIAGNVFSQTRPTSKVKKALFEKYENAKIVRWESETERNRVTIWKAFYTLDDVLRVACFDPKGNWIQTKTEIEKDALPEAVLKSIDENYYQYKIVITARFENPETEGYEVFLDNGQDGFNVQFSKEGDVLNRTIRSKGYKPIDNEGKEIED
ncbi:MAG: PepSY-like domain-containing protein [Bacteroidetes bacterium]|nr:PepSY-like domain-containing protein [Bacteroidota bacterium]